LEQGYATMVGDYVRAFRMKQEPPRPAIKEIALALSSVGYGAREIARLHSRILDRVARRALPDAERAYSADARLALIEVLGRVLDIYHEQSKALISSPDPSRLTLQPRGGIHG
jgi:hypothetical protein